MTQTYTMTEGRPGRLIFKFALPLMIGNLFQQFYMVADTMIVGRVLGVGAIAAIGATDWLTWMMLGTVQGFTQGFSIWMAQEFGAGRPAQLRNVIVHSIFLSAILAVLLVAAGQGLAAFSLRILQTPDSVFRDAEGYLRTIFWGLPVTVTYNLLASVLRSLGDSKTPLYAMVFASIINILLDLWFVAGLGYGVTGAAAATVIAQVFAGVFCYGKIRRIDILRLTRGDAVLHGGACMRLIYLGFPMAFQNIIISIGGMIIQYLVNGFGVLFLAAYTATNKLYGLLEMAATSYGYAMSTYAGQNLGAGKITRIRDGYRAALAIAAVTSLLILTVTITGGRTILGFFLSGDEAAVTETLEIAYHYLFIMSVFLPTLYYLHVTRSCIQGMGNTVLPMVSGICEFVMRTGSAPFLPLLFGQEGIFLAEALAWIGADVVLAFSYAYCYRKTERRETAAGSLPAS